jgi:hypothetical protein
MGYNERVSEKAKSPFSTGYSAGFVIGLTPCSISIGEIAGAGRTK